MDFLNQLDVPKKNLLNIDRNKNNNNFESPRRSIMNLESPKKNKDESRKSIMSVDSFKNRGSFAILGE